MTTEKAIQLLHRLSDEQFDSEYGDERREALEMAVRALESNLVKESDGLVHDLVKDCISRKMAIDALSQMQGIIVAEDGIRKGISLAWQQIKDLPSAQPRKKGKWIFHETENDRYDDMICPFCKTTYTVDAYRIDDIGFTAEDFNYCPNCGADMRGESDE